MTAYVFETITAAQALAYDAANDTLAFTAPGASASGLYVTFNSGLGSDLRVELTLSATNQTVVFGPGMAPESGLTFADGSQATIGPSRNNSSVSGSGANDALFGGMHKDTISGGEGADTLVGGGWGDNLSGGSGADVYAVFRGDSPNTDPSNIDTVTDWEAQDRIAFGPLTVTASNYQEFSAGAYSEAYSYASTKIANKEADVVSVQVGSTVYVFGDVRLTNTAPEVVALANRSLSDINYTNFVALAPRSGFGGEHLDYRIPLPASLPNPQDTYSGDMDQLNIGSMIGMWINENTSTHLGLGGTGGSFDIRGYGFVYDSNDQIIGGTITSVQAGSANLIHSAGVPVSAFIPLVYQNASQAALQLLLGGANDIIGSQGRDLIRTFDGADTITGLGGSDTFFGGEGNDHILATYSPLRDSSGVTYPTGSTYLRGDAGDDYIVGGAGFDDINGNQGADTADGLAGNDWVVGGKDNDLLTGNIGDDIVYGNLGQDTCYGGAGNDVVRGGQGDDVISGDAGNDWMSGDRGSDTISGGGGADTFNVFGDAGVDRITDFNAADGDRIQIERGVSYTASQSGADTVLDIAGGARVTLVGVSLSSLPSGWIFAG